MFVVGMQNFLADSWVGHLYFCTYFEEAGCLVGKELSDFSSQGCP